jgi:hypothetical protein
MNVTMHEAFPGRRRRAVPCLPRHSMLNSSILVQDIVALEFVDVAGQFMDRSPRQTAQALHDPSHRGLAQPGVQGQLGRQRVATAIVGEVSRRDTEGTSPARPLRVRWIRAGTRAQLRKVRRRQLNPGPLRDDADSVDRSLPESMRDQSERPDRQRRDHNMRTRQRRAATAHRRRHSAKPLDDEGTGVAESQRVPHARHADLSCRRIGTRTTQFKSGPSA